MRRGPLYMTLAGLSFTVMVSFVKLAREELPAIDVIFWRGLIAIPLAAGLATRVGFRLHNVPLFCLRATFGFAAMIGFFHATKGLAVADLSLIHKLQPIIIGLAAPFVLGASERTGRFVWVLLLTGLAGCALIIAPHVSVGSTFGLFALAATVGSAGAHLCVRGLTRTDDARVIVLYFQTTAMVLSASYIFASTGAPPTVPNIDLWLPILGVGVFATIGQLLMTQAYAEDRATVVAAASYSTPIWGVIADLSIFSTAPSGYAIAGGIIIVSAGLVLIVGKGNPVEAAPAVKDDLD